MARLVGLASLLAVLPSLFVAGLDEHSLAGQAREPLAWQACPGPAQAPGAEPKRVAPLPTVLFTPQQALATQLTRTALAGRRAFLASRRGAQDIPRLNQMLFRRMGGADEPDSPSR